MTYVGMHGWLMNEIWLMADVRMATARMANVRMADVCMYVRMYVWWVACDYYIYI